MKKVFIFICSLVSLNAFSQESETSDVITSIAEELASDEDIPETVELFIQQLYELVENPVRINSGDEKEISRLFFLSDFQVKALIDYISSSGNIVSVYEIAAIPGFDRQTAEWMVRFISLQENPYGSSKNSRLRNSLLSNLILKSGRPDSTCPGSPLKVLTRYSFEAGSYSGGFTAEKDAGEKLFAGTPPMPDFLSAYLVYSTRGIMKKIIIGDYSSRFGLGTNINTGMHTALSLNSPGYMSVRNEIKPLKSTEENNYFRGVAGEFSYKKLGLILFFSINNIDASVELSEDSSKLFVSGLYSAGLHNGPGLVLKKDVLTNTSCGINLSFSTKSLRTGMSWTHTSFSIPFEPEANDPEKLYDFRGYNNSILSVHYNYLINRLLLFGELSGNNPGALAFIQGVTIRPSDRFSVNFLYRNYSPGFVSFHGKGPGNTSSTSNEKGIMGTFSFEFAKHFFITAGCNISNSPWLQYRTSFPSFAKKYQVRFRYLPDEKYSFDLSYDLRSAMYDTDRDQGISLVSENDSRTLRGVAKIMVNERLTVSTRSDTKFARPSGSNGMLLLQDLNYRFRRIPLTIWFRYCIFKTDDWNSRLYTYENDLLYSFSVPALSGDGTRSYVMLKWDLKDFAEMRIKYGFTERQDKGSVSEKIQDIKVQFRIWF